MENLTAPQSKVLSSIGTSHADASKYDRRVINSLAKRGLLSLVDSEQGLMASLTKEGQDAASQPAKVRKAAKSAKKNGKAKKARAPKAEAGPCICGCGKRTLSAKRQFLQGHDASLHSLFLKIGRGEEKRSAFPKDPRALEYVQSAPWSTKAKRDAFDAAK